MSYLRGAAFAAAFMFVANTSFAADTVLDRLVHELDEHVTELENEVHSHHPNTHLDSDVHEVHEALHAFLKHIHHGDHHHELHRLYQPLRNAIAHMNQTARRMGHWDYVGHGFFRRRVWHSDVSPHVQREINHVNSVNNQIWRHFHGWGHGHGHGHGHHPHH